MTRRSLQVTPSLVKITLLSAVVLILSSATVLAQDTAPERGFRPAGSYSVSDIETISTTNGNMMLRVPLAGLPPGRGGLSAGLNLIYNSKLYDGFPSRVYTPANIYDVTRLKQSQAGGWRYAYKYQLYDEGRDPGLDDGQQEQDGCAMFNGYVVKLSLLTPDGGKHPLRLAGYTDGDGYQNVIWDGNPVCGGAHLYTTLSYFTTDGTFLRLDVEHDSDSNPSNNPWTLFLPDGGRVSNTSSSQKIYDRNNNYIEIVNGTYAGRAATYINDQVGRSIIIDYESSTNQDSIRVTGFNNAALVTTVAWTNVAVHKSYYSEAGPAYGFNPTWRSVSQITLPSQAGSLSYIFTYNANGSTPTVGWGEVSSITLPSGAKTNYTYAADSYNNIGFEAVLYNRPITKQLVIRPEYDVTSVSNTPCGYYSGEPCITETTNYGMTYSGSIPISSTITAPDGGVTTEYFNKKEDGTLDWAESGLVYKSVAPDGSVVERYWQNNIPPGSPGLGESFYVKLEFVSIVSSGTPTLTAIKEYSYDKNGNVTKVAAYDWVPYGNVPRNGQGRPYAVPSGVSPKTITVNTYYNPTPDASDSTTSDSDSFHIAGSPRLHRLLESSEVQDAGGTAFSRSEILYDYTATNGVVSYPIGNSIERRNWDSTKGSISRPLGTGNRISSSTQYDTFGNPTLTTDARGVTTGYCYSTGDCAVSGQTANLYVTRIKVAENYSGLTRTTTKKYDFNTGVVKEEKDVDNDVTMITSYNDLARPILVENADGKSEETQTETLYSDADRRVIVRSDLSTVDDDKLVSIRHYDQLGRIRLARQLEDSTTESATNETHGIKVETRYAITSGASYHITSNPYRVSSEGTIGWTRSKNDVAGRIVEVQTFGGSSLPAPWGSNATSTGTVTTAYDAQFTTITDQAGRVRRSLMNGLGQLARVDEPTTSGLGTTSSPNQATSYTYDALSNLVRVEQGSQNRYLMYDSLSRLRRSRNPEQDNSNSSLNLSDPITGNSVWSVGYVYDDTGNLYQKTDARGVVMEYLYDALNRNTNVNYSDSTPDVVRQYDQATKGKGRLHQVSQSGSTTSATYIDSYDALGRPLVMRQRFETSGVWSASYQVSRTYNRAGGVTSQTYPSGRTVSYDFDGAGRVNGFSGDLGDSSQRTYSTGILYSPFGGIKKEQFGTDTALYNKTFYNSRGQWSETRLSTSYTSELDTNRNRGSVINNYSAQCTPGAGASCIGTDNNGNLTSQQVFIPHDEAIINSTSWYQKYDYDELNRVQRAKEYNSSNTQLWQQEYGYDRWGNRSLHQTNTWGTGINKTELAFDSTNNNNRLVVPAGKSGTIAYDAAGNLTTDTYTAAGGRTYDAENRMTSAQGINQSVWQYYTYNADGQRVRRKIDGVETWQVYGMGSELLAEYAASAATTSPQKEYGYRNGELLITASVVNCGVGYQGAKSWSATNVALGHIVGHQEGSDWVGSTSSDSAGYFSFGPYDNSFGQGHHSAGFLLQVDNTSGSDVVATLDVVTGYGGTILSQRQIRRNEFTAANQWQWFTLEFDNPCFGLVEGRIYWHDTVNFKFNQLTITGVSSSGLAVNWLVADHLGTPRMMFDKTGLLANTKRHDYLPFGEELFAGAGGRTTWDGYAGDLVRQKFTQKERDNETGLDYFFARYYSNVQGRFTSVDPENAGADESDPQSWNGYAYARNNPVLYIDPDGQKFKICYQDGDCHEVSDEEWKRIKGDAQKLGSVFKDNKIYNEVDGQLVATASYKRTGFDDLNDFANGVIFGNSQSAGLVDRAPAAGNAALALWGGSVAVGAGIGAGLYAAPAITAAIVERQVAGRIASELANATVNRRVYAQLEKQLASAGAKSIYKALRKAEKALGEHVRKSGDAYFKSSIEGTIKNVANQIKTIQRFIKDKGL